MPPRESTPQRLCAADHEARALSNLPTGRLAFDAALSSRRQNGLQSVCENLCGPYKTRFHIPLYPGLTACTKTSSAAKRTERVDLELTYVRHRWIRRKQASCTGHH